jgi:excisionase family DNA binding protein
MPSPREPYVDSQQVARYLGVSPSTVGRLVKKHLVPSYAVLGRRLFRLSEIDRVVQRHKCAANN